MLNYSYLLSECILSKCYVLEALFLLHYASKEYRIWYYVGIEVSQLPLQQLHYLQLCCSWLEKCNNKKTILPITCHGLKGSLQGPLSCVNLKYFHELLYSLDFLRLSLFSLLLDSNFASVILILSGFQDWCYWYCLLCQVLHTVQITLFKLLQATAQPSTFYVLTNHLSKLSYCTPKHDALKNPCEEEAQLGEGQKIKAISLKVEGTTFWIIQKMLQGLKFYIKCEQ